MAITVLCPSCGKKLQAPDSAAGKRAKCPGCGQVMQLPEAVYDAEEVADEFGVQDLQGPPGGFSPEDFEETYAIADDQPSEAPRQPQQPPRRPCPACGEMIVAGAAKCRFCGEIFDTTVGLAQRIDPELVRRFRRDIQGLGGFWIFIGGLVFVMAFVLPGMNDVLPEEEAVAVAVVLGFAGVVWVTLGVLACVKHVWAVYVGLVLSYLSLIANLFQINVCALLVLAFVIIQAHRSINSANKMRRAGIPLTTTAERLRRRRRYG